MPIYEMPQPVAPIGTKITRLAFLSRFTDEEAIAIDLASIGASVEAATVRRYLSLIDAAEHIDLSYSMLKENIGVLETSGLIAEGRAAEILDTPITSYELPI